MVTYIYSFYEDSKLLGIFDNKENFKYSIISYLVKKISPTLNSSQFQIRYENNMKEFYKQKETIINGVKYSMDIQISNKIHEDKWKTKYKKLNIKYKCMDKKQKIPQIKI